MGLFINTNDPAITGAQISGPLKHESQVFAFCEFYGRPSPTLLHLTDTTFSNMHLILTVYLTQRV